MSALGCVTFLPLAKSTPAPGNPPDSGQGAQAACHYDRVLADRADKPSAMTRSAKPEVIPMFRKLNDRIFASPQITLDEVAEAQRLGIGLIINNRPEGESDDQTPGDAIEAAARAAGIAYLAIPVTHAGFSEAQVKAMAAALAASDTPVLAYCRSGTRSTLLWALAEASRGESPDALAAAAAGAGYDVTPVRALMDMLAARES